MRARLVILTAALLAGTAGAAAPTLQVDSSFAAVLADRPIYDPSAVVRQDPAESLLAVASAPPSERQAARWDHARNLLALRRPAEALGVLDVMRADDPDLPLVPQYQFAFGVALSGLSRHGEALAALAEPALAAQPEACRLRLRAFAALEMQEAVGDTFKCAAAGSAKMAADRQRELRLDAARLALLEGQPGRAFKWLAPLAETDPAAKLLRGQIHAAAGETQEARLLFERAERTGTPAERAEATLSRLELAARTGDFGAQDQSDLHRLLLTWRGDRIERRALALELDTARNDREALAAGATLMRYHRLGARARPLLEKMGARLADSLSDPDADDLESVGGLLWDYRDLLPQGTQGDRVVVGVARRFQREGLYERAAELLDYLLAQRVEDQAKGPLSVDVASLYILAGQPERALAALKRSDQVLYVDEIANERRKIEAVTLYHLRRPKEALAVLQDVPGARGLTADIAWEGGDWSSFVEANRAALPVKRVDDMGRAALLRQAIALAMLGDRKGLAEFQAAHAAQIEGETVAPLLDLLARGEAPGADQFAAAMAALPRLPADDRYTELLTPPVKGPRSKKAALGG